MLHEESTMLYSWYPLPNRIPNQVASVGFTCTYYILFKTKNIEHNLYPSIIFSRFFLLLPNKVYTYTYLHS